MATVRCGCSGCNSCSQSTSGCGCTAYGALSSVAGPLNRLSIPGYENFPYYTGPCGPCEPCSRCCCPNLPWSGGYDVNSSASASFVAGTPISLPSGGVVALTPTLIDAQSFASGQDGVLIRNAGTYMVFYTVHVPASETVSSRFYLALNGSALPASIQDVSVAAESACVGSSAHLLLEAPAGGLLTLVSTDPLSINPQTTAPNVFTLSIVRIS